MKLAGLVILYEPPQNVLENILTYYAFVERLFIFDNTESVSNAALFSHLQKASFFHDGKNEGIARRLNEGCKMAAAEGFNWLLTMDQDSRFPLGSSSAYLQCVETYNVKENVAVFGTAYNEKPLVSSVICHPVETNFIITSGAIVNLSIQSTLNGFDENLFIDLVDHEYCARANMMNFKTIQFTNIYMYHELGEEVHRSSVKTLFLVKKRKIIHSPQRYYYMYRNMLYLRDKYSESNPQFVKLIHKKVMTLINTCLYYGRQTSKLFKYIRLAKKDYKNNSMGKSFTTDL